jgi:antitoxin HicB
MPRYTVLVYPDEGNYSVVVPALDGCVTWGHTVDEALAMARDAIRLHLAGLVEHGEEIPEEDEPPLVATVDVPPAVAAL